MGEKNLAPSGIRFPAGPATYKRGSKLNGEYIETDRASVIFLELGE